jgi:lipid-A-disaccharide synthase-like uncharacterized protein
MWSATWPIVTAIFGIRAITSWLISRRLASSSIPFVRWMYSAHRGVVAEASSWDTNEATNVTITTPPFFGSSTSTSSGTLRG